MQALVLIALVILLFLQSLRSVVIVGHRRSHLSFAIILIVLYARGPDPQRLHARRPHARHGAASSTSRWWCWSPSTATSARAAARVRGGAGRGERRGARRRWPPRSRPWPCCCPSCCSPVSRRSSSCRSRSPSPMAMIAAYFVSMVVTPVACRYFLGHAEPGRFGRAVESAIDGVAARYASVLRRCCRTGSAVVIAAVALVVASVCGRRAPAEHVLPRDRRVDGARLRALRAGHLAARTPAPAVDEMGRAAARELPRGDVELVLTNVGSPSNARSAMTSPNAGPHMGFIRAGADATPEHRTPRSARSPTGCAGCSIGASRAWSSSSGREAWWRASSPTGTSPRWWWRCAARTSDHARGAGRGDRRGRAHGAGRARRLRRRSQHDYPELRVDTDRSTAGLVGVDVAAGRAGHARGDARQHQHAPASGSTRTTASRITW